MTALALITPIDPGTGSRVTVRLCSSNDPQATGAASETWWPAIVEEPVVSLSLFDGDFSSAVEPGNASIALRIDVLREARRATSLFPRVERYDWAGAKVVLYRLVSGALVDLAVMRVEGFSAANDVLSLRLAVDSEWADANVLFNEYAGTTGIEGGADLKGRPKPWVFGRASNVEPVFINQIDNVFQVSGYGPVSAISAVYERGASFGASVGNFATYAALVAATIPPGRWATCLAQGLFRLGAPPAGVITCDVDGDSTVGFLRRTGAILSEIARRLGVSAMVSASSLSALDTAVPRNVNIVISEQTSFIDLARRMAAPCNAVAGLGLNGVLITPRVAFGTEALTLDAQGRQMPPVLGIARQNTRPPYKRIRMGAARSWRVHSFDEIAFFAELIDRGLYIGSETYREGHIVETADKARWVYINPTPSSGNAPPTWPTASNAFWSNIAPPISEVGGVPVAQLLADVVAANAAAAAAQTSANTANTAISNITADNILSIDEKPEIRKQRDEIIAERPIIRARAVALGVAVANYDADYTALIAYLDGLDLSGATNTAITRTTFNTFFTDYYAERQTVLDGIADEASKRAALAPANANRVPFSRFEGGSRGWVVNNPSGVGLATAFSNVEGRDVGLYGVSFTSAAQVVGVRSELFPIAEAGQVSAQVRFGIEGGGVTTWVAALFFFDDASGFIGSTAIASGTAVPAWRNPPLQEFIPVPSNARTAYLLLQAVASGAGTRNFIITEPMVVPAAFGQKVHPAFSPGPAGDPNNLITIDAGGLLQGIGLGAGEPVNNKGVVLSGTVAARPASGAYIGQTYVATDTREFYRWNGSAWIIGSDVTTEAVRVIEPQFPVIEIKQGEAGHTGTRTVTHVAKRGGVAITGGTWSIASTALTGATVTVNSSTGTVSISGVTISGSYTIRYTHTDGVPTDWPVNVTYLAIPIITTATTVVKNIGSSTTFVVISNELSIQIPTGVTEAQVVTSAIQLRVSGFPAGDTNVELRVTRETSPGTWTAVGAVQASSPHPRVDDVSGLPVQTPGSVTISRTATGLSAGSTQKFRLEGRVSGGNIKGVTAAGTVTAGA